MPTRSQEILRRRATSCQQPDHGQQRERLFDMPGTRSMDGPMSSWPVACRRDTISLLRTRWVPAGADIEASLAAESQWSALPQPRLSCHGRANFAPTPNPQSSLASVSSWLLGVALPRTAVAQSDSKARAQSAGSLLEPAPTFQTFSPSCTQPWTSGAR